MARTALERLQDRIIACERCPRLREHCAEVARTRRRMYADQEYWGRPVPSFGDPRARLWILGLAPAAHGANRTGRMFTGDSSGDWLYEALHRYGFANQPQSVGRDDGLRLRDVWISAAAHCAPPANKPTRTELEACRPWLHAELDAHAPGLVLVLGRIAWQTWRKVVVERGNDALPADFSNGGLHAVPGQIPELQSYHPSRQNTNTGRLTREMWHAVFERARELL